LTAGFRGQGSGNCLAVKIFLPRHFPRTLNPAS
jgi:hypothetical protein